MATAPHHADAPSPALIFDLINAHQRSSALLTAIELDLFRAIGEGPGDTASLARHCQATERGIRILCDFLVILGVLRKEDNRYLHTPTSATFLDPRSPACQASVAQFMGRPELFEPYRRLTEVVRNGRTTLPGEGTVEPDNPVWVDFARGMAPMMGPLAEPFAQLVLEGVSGPVRVLDIAAGHGLFGIAFAQQNPQARIVAQDWAQVLAVAQENAVKAGVTDRYEQLPGSAFDVEYGGPYDIVLLTNFLHHFDRETCVGLLRKIRAACKPGAKVAALEFVPNEDRVTPPVPAAFALVMLASTGSGDAYTLSEYDSMYREGGFSSVTGHPLPVGVHTAVVGIV